MKIDENIILNRLSTIRAIAKWKLPQIMKSMKEEQQKQDELTSQSAKLEQPTHNCEIMECDPEGMKPKSKYEKAFRDVKE